MKQIDKHTLDALKALADKAFDIDVSERLSTILYGCDGKIFEEAEIFTKTDKYDTPVVHYNHVTVRRASDGETVDIDTLYGQWKHDMICAIRNYVWDEWYNSEDENL